MAAVHVNISKTVKHVTRAATVVYLWLCETYAECGSGCFPERAAAAFLLINIKKTSPALLTNYRWIASDAQMVAKEQNKSCFSDFTSGDTQLGIAITPSSEV